MAKNNKGVVVQITGPVLDIRFANTKLPKLNNAIEVINGKEVIIVEVAKHIGDDTVKCVSMGSTEGLKRGLEAIDTGKPISVPVGPITSGRMFNVVGQPIDEKPAPKAKL
jgi:F-type H+-transporting ATPase subunit beta